MYISLTNLKSARRGVIRAFRRIDKSSFTLINIYLLASYIIHKRPTRTPPPSSHFDQVPAYLADGPEPARRDFCFRLVSKGTPNPISVAGNCRDEWGPLVQHAHFGPLVWFRSGSGNGRLLLRRRAQRPGQRVGCVALPTGARALHQFAATRLCCGHHVHHVFGSRSLKSIGAPEGHPPAALPGTAAAASS